MEQSRLEALMALLSKEIEQRRRKLSISQDELAKQAGLSRAYLSDIERGQRNISIVTLVRLAEALSTTPSELLSAVEDKHKSSVGS